MNKRGTFTFDPTLEPADREAVLGLAVRLLQAQERLLRQPAEGCDGQRGVVTNVALNCDNRVVAKLQVWKGGPATYYAEDVRTAKEIGA